MKYGYTKLYFITIAILFVHTVCPRLNMRGQTSFVSVASGANLVIDQLITGFNGTLTKSSGASLTGQNITFSNGIFQDAGNQLILSAVFTPTGTLSLSGDQKVLAQQGTVLQSVAIAGTGNQIIGRPIFSSPITLQNGSAALTFAIDNALTSSVVLNSGTLTLNSDLAAADGVQFVGPGTLNLNGKRLSLGGKNLTWSTNLSWQDASDISLNGNVDLSATWTLTGTTRINGNGNIVDLSSGGAFYVASGGVLYLNDIVLRGLGATGVLAVLGSASEVHFSNVTIELGGNVTSALGKFYVDGPMTIVVKNFTWTFDTSALLTVRGVTLWTDPAGATTYGSLAFGMPQSSFLNLIANGRIKSIGVLDQLQTSTGYLQTQVTANADLISELQTSTGYLQNLITTFSLVEIINEALQSSTVLQSLIEEVILSDTDLTGIKTQVDLNTLDITALQNVTSALQTSTGYLQTQITSNLNLTTLLQTSTGYLQTQITINASLASLLQTSTGYLQAQITNNNNLLQTSTGYLQTQITANASLASLLQSSTGYLQTQITQNAADIAATNAMLAMVKTSTGYLQTQINSNDVEILALQTLTSALQTSSGYLQTQVTQNAVGISQLRTSTGYLQIQIDSNDVDILALQTLTSALQTSSGYLQTQITANASLASLLQTSTGYLQTQIIANDGDIASINSMLTMIKTSTGYLQTQINANDLDISALQTSTGYLQQQIDNTASGVISALQTSTGYLQNQITANDSDILALQNVTTAVQTSTGYLQTQITANANLASLLQTSSGYLQTQITNNNSLLQTSTGYLQTQITANAADIAVTNAMLAMVKSSTGYLQDQITANDVEIAALQLVTMQLQTSTGELYEDLIIAASSLTMLVNDILLSSTILQSIIEEVIMTDTDLTGLKNQVDLNTVAISGLQNVTTALQTSTGYLQTQITQNAADIAATNAMLAMVKTSTGYLQMQITANTNLASLLQTSTGYLQDQITANDGDISVINSMLAMVKTSTGYLQEQITSGANLAVLLQTSTGYLQDQITANDGDISVINSMLAMIKTSTGYLQNQISANDLDISALQTSTGYLQTQITANDSDILALQNVTTAIQTSTGYLQNQVNANANLASLLQTSTGYLQNQITTQGITIAQLQTSTGILQVEIDVARSLVDNLYDELFECCFAQLTTQTGAPDAIKTVDWAHSNTLLVVGLDNSALIPTSIDEQVLRSYAFNNGALTLLATYTFLEYREVQVVRYHPTQNLVAVGRVDAGGGPGLTIFAVDPTTGAFTLKSSAEVFQDVYAVAWHPDGDRLAVARNISGAQVAIYGVMLDGTLTGTVVTVDTDREVEPKALDWNNTGQYLAAGINVNSIFGALQVWAFNKGSSTLTLNVGTDVPSTRGNPLTNSTVLAVAWNKVTPTLLSAGLEYASAGLMVQAFEHNGTAATLTYNAGISGISNDVNALSWNPNEDCLSVGISNNAGGELRTYAYNDQTKRFYQGSAFDFGSTAVEDVRFSSDAQYIASGATNNNASVYSMYCKFLPRLDIVESLIDLLDTQVDEIATSTGYLQSEINTQGMLISALQTSTGYLQSQIDALATSTADEALTLRVDILEIEVNDLQLQVNQLQSIVESCCDVIIPPVGDTTIIVSSELCVTPTMLPTLPGFTVEFKFTNSAAKAIFDPLCLGSSMITLPAQSGMIFTGPGQALFKNNLAVQFDNSATCGDVSPLLGTIIITTGATMTLDMNATLTLSGDVALSLLNDGYLLLDNQSALILGASSDDVIQLNATSYSSVTVDNPDARITFNRACYDVMFNNSSFLNIESGLVEFNTSDGSYFVAPGVPATGILRTFQFTNGAGLNINPDGSGMLTWAQNSGNAPVSFNTIGSLITSGGLMQYQEFNGSGVATLNLDLKIQGNDQNKTSATSPMVSLYVRMCRLPGNTGFNYAAILVAHNLPLPPSVFGLPPSAVAVLCLDVTSKPTGGLFILPISAFKVINKPGSGLVTYSVGVDTITKPC